MAAALAGVGVFAVTALAVSSVDFNFSPSSPQPSDSVTFTITTDNTDQDNPHYVWDFGDGSATVDTASTTTSHTFTTAGHYDVQVKLEDGSDTILDTKSHPVVVNTPPTAAFTFDPTTPNPNQTVNFDGTTSSDSEGSVTYSWDLNDDGTFGDSTAANPTKSFSTPGTHTVHLRVTDGDGATDTVSHDVVVNSPPTAAFTFSPTTPNTGDTINLDGSGSSDTDGSIATYAWDLDNNGTFTDSSSATPTTSFNTAGAHVVKLRVTDDNGATNTISHTITVNAPPTAAFTSSPTHPTPGATVSFDGTGSSDPEDGTVASYAWDLDNNGTFTDSSSATPTTSFGTAGAHTVKLRVTDSNGATNTVTHTVNVNAPPAAAFTSSPAHPIPGQTVSFDGSTSSDSDGTIASYSWDLNNDGTFGDSTSSTPTTSFATAGTHTVKLRVTDNFGATNTVTHDVTVNAVPTAAFTFSPVNPDPNQSISLDGTASSDSDGSIASYSWDLNGDGTFGDSTASNPNTSFSTPGQHTVRLKVTDNFGATSPVVSHVISVNGPVPDFNWTPASPVTGQTVTFNNTSTEIGGGTLSPGTWDLNNDGTCGDDPGETDASPTKAFPAPGNYTVKLCESDAHTDNSVTKVVTVANRPPAASFTFGPANPLPGDLVTFNSTSSDPDGPIASTAWDLNNNSVFGEPGETGLVVSRTFPAPGTYPVTLQVTDQNGATATAFDSVTVLAPAAPTKPPAEPQPINPFPIVTIRGKLTRAGVKIASLVVQTPVGTTVTVKCKGRHCPFKSLASVAKVRKLKVKKLQRSLRGDLVLELFITHPGDIGKYTRFHIRSKGKSPVRQDRCLAADTNAIVRCPS